MVFAGAARPAPPIPAHGSASLAVHEHGTVHSDGTGRVALELANEGDADPFPSSDGEGVTEPDWHDQTDVPAAHVSPPPPDVLGVASRPVPPVGGTAARLPRYVVRMNRPPIA